MFLAFSPSIFAAFLRRPTSASAASPNILKSSRSTKPSSSKLGIIYFDSLKLFIAVIHECSLFRKITSSLFFFWYLAVSNSWKFEETYYRIFPPIGVKAIRTRWRIYVVKTEAFEIVLVVFLEYILLKYILKRMVLCNSLIRSIPQKVWWILM